MLGVRLRKNTEVKNNWPDGRKVDIFIGNSYLLVVLSSPIRNSFRIRKSRVITREFS